MKTVLIFISLLLGGADETPTPPILFAGLAWGSAPEAVAEAAAQAGWHEEDEEESESGMELTYSLPVFGTPSEATFRFSPSGKKLYAVELGWEEEDVPPRLRTRLLAELGLPRQEQEALGVTTWTRGMTEAELRRHDDCINLLYASLTLWKEAREERDEARSD